MCQILKTFRTARKTTKFLTSVLIQILDLFFLIVHKTFVKFIFQIIFNEKVICNLTKLLILY